MMRTGEYGIAQAEMTSPAKRKRDRRTSPPIWQLALILLLGSAPVVRTQAPCFFRVNLVLQEPFTPAMESHQSADYRTLDYSLRTALENLFEGDYGRRYASVISIKPSTEDKMKTEATVDLGLTGTLTENAVVEKILNHVRSYRKLSSIVVDDDTITVRPFGACQTVVAPRPDNRQSCSPNELPCQSGECLPHSARCNGRAECGDGSDERGCPQGSDGWREPPEPTQTSPSPQPPTITVSIIEPSIHIAEEGRTVRFRCSGQSIRQVPVKVSWSKESEQLPRGRAIDNGQGVLIITRVEPPDSGVYVCSVDDGYKVASQRAILNVGATSCQSDEYRCRDGLCLDIYQRCDAIEQCSEGEDELECAECRADQYECGDGTCIDYLKRCDGNSDCSDNSDESDCERSGRPETLLVEPAEYSGPTDQPVQLRCHSPSNNATLFWTRAEGVPLPASAHSQNGALTLYSPRPSDSGVYVCRATRPGYPPTTAEAHVSIIAGSTLPPASVISTQDSAFAVPDSMSVMNRSQSICQKGYFNDLASTEQDCIPCFCFGISMDCKSADFFTYQVPSLITEYRLVLVHLDPDGKFSVQSNTPLSISSVKSASQTGFQLFHHTGYEMSSENEYIYFLLPESYLGNHLKSYGGYVKYTVRLEECGSSRRFPDVILSGNGYTLVHYANGIEAGRENNVSVQFFYGHWYKHSHEVHTGANIPSSSLIEDLASREEIMMALSNIDNILIRGQYVQSPQLNMVFLNIGMDSAGIHNTGQGQATSVEICHCPDGYMGLSCEQCAPGYHRHRSGPWLGLCTREVVQCYVSSSGQYSDPSRSISCQDCQCHSTSVSKQSGRLETPLIEPAEYYGLADQTVRIQCHSPSLNATLLWTRAGGAPLPASAQSQDGALIFYSPQPSDSGVYVCEAAHPGYLPSTAETNVSFIAYSASVKVKSHHQKVPQGSTAELRCVAIGAPQSAISWTRYGRPLPDGTASKAGPILRIPNVTVHDGGIYVCSVTVPGRLTASKPSVLEVRRREPTVNRFPCQQTVIVGEVVDIQCQVTGGYPRPTVRWSRSDGRPLSSSIIKFSGDVLRFEGVIQADEGQYICTAENPAGVATVTAELDVQELPRISLSPSSPVSAVEGQRIRLECRASGDPPPMLTWSRHRPGANFYETQPVTVEQPQTAVYEIKQVTKVDEGLYTCQATNAIYSIEERLLLTVEEANSPGE